eukprot:3620196-Rhodomonas_salina.1
MPKKAKSPRAKGGKAAEKKVAYPRLSSALAVTYARFSSSSCRATSRTGMHGPITSVCFATCPCARCAMPGINPRYARTNSRHADSSAGLEGEDVG